MRLIIYFILYFSLSPAAAQFSNIIVFGDSLSDGGNFPESQQVFWKAQLGKELNNYVPQLYVPFSNPVNPQSKGSKWPILDDRYLSTQVPIKHQNRKYRSISWPQFFLTFSKIANPIVPSHLLRSRSIPSNFSVNYSWGYAASTKNCVNPLYEPVKCNSLSIENARTQYFQNPTEENYKKIEVPGVFKQVHLFIKDLHDHKISVDQHSLYVFWISGNDLIIASNALLQHKNVIPAWRILMGNSALHIFKSVNILLQALPKRKRPKVIYVSELFNPQLTPGYYYRKISPIGNFVVKAHNFWLKIGSEIFNLFSDVKIKIMPTYQWYQLSSKNPVFEKTMGKACQMDGGDYTNPLIIPNSNCEGFMFWNAVHPASPMNEIVGEKMVGYMRNEG